MYLYEVLVDMPDDLEVLAVLAENEQAAQDHIDVTTLISLGGEPYNVRMICQVEGYKNAEEAMEALRHAVLVY